MDAYTKFCCHCDGSAGSLDFTDSSTSAHTIYNQNSAVVNANVKKFGTGSCEFGVVGGTSAQLTVTAHSDFHFASSAWTIDFWMNISANASSWNALLSYTIGVAGWDVMMSADNQIRLVLGSGAAWKDDKTSSATIAVNTWTHIAFTSKGQSDGTIRCFINGNKDWELGTANYTIGDPSSGVFTIGNYRLTGTYQYDGYMDEIRVSKGIDRWTANFTPPTEAYNGIVPNQDVGITRTIGAKLLRGFVGGGNY